MGTQPESVLPVEGLPGKTYLTVPASCVGLGMTVGKVVLPED